MHKISIVKRLNIGVIKKKSHEEAVISFYKITKEIVDRPSILLDEKLDELRTMLNKAFKRVLCINNDCTKRILLRNKLNGEPQDWFNAVFELRILSGPEMQLTA